MCLVVISRYSVVLSRHSPVISKMLKYAKVNILDITVEHLDITIEDIGWLFHSWKSIFLRAGKQIIRQPNRLGDFFSSKIIFPKIL